VGICGVAVCKRNKLKVRKLNTGNALLDGYMPVAAFQKGISIDMFRKPVYLK
jgi:hypothetical protein